MGPQTVTVADMSKESDLNFYGIYDGHYARIKAFMLARVRDPWVAEDLTQDTFLRVFKGLASLKDPGKLSPWIYRIAQNTCRDYYRRNGRRSLQALMEEGPASAEAESSPLKEIEKHQMGACVQQKVGQLPKSYRNVLWLFDFMGLSHGEIAALLNLSRENVKVRLHRARGKLKAILREQCRFERDDRDVFVCEPRANMGTNTIHPHMPVQENVD